MSQPDDVCVGTGAGEADGDDLPGSFRLLLATNPLPMWVYDRETLRFLEVNDAAVARYGYSREQFRAMRITDIRPPEDVEPLVDDLASERRAFQRSGPWRHRTASGTVMEVEVSSHLVRWDGCPAVLVTASDAAGSRDSGKTAVGAHEDVPGHEGVLAALRAALEEDGARPALLVIDLHRVARTVAVAGVAAMYAMIEKIVGRLAGLKRPGDLLGRLGSTTFALVTPYGTPEGSERLARDVMEALQETLELPGIGEVAVAPAIGVRLADDGEKDAEVMLRDASASMDEAATSEAADIVFFRPDLRVAATLRFALEQALRQGLRVGEFRLYYQPIVAVASGEIEGYEGLLRWERPGHGLVGPAGVIEVAEHSGLIGSLGDFVFERGLLDLGRMQADRPGSYVALNLSPYQLARPRLAERFLESCSAAGVDPSGVCLELTESAFVSAEVGHLGREQLVALRAAGAKIAIDDFGTGYSALSYLKGLPVDVVKIDRAFVTGLGRNDADAILVEAITRLAHALGLTVVAEGVETIEQLEHLRALGVDSMQGYLLARPAPLSELIGC